ncbi:Zinc finger, RING/FYVE/PHD-type [Cynara cardunculus var. scolymus]|uniref:Zinc finger, RING/FYVE/PHD-type n=1 Tax=Cynara cardunculus var. scolymus TaxID=59895 RepID=A0A103XQV5_CYNCS|nr:Zinc finger, RING/FYVE/PHD-type [Cynara cardunculus var. scolymus]
MTVAYASESDSESEAEPNLYPNPNTTSSYFIENEIFIATSAIVKLVALGYDEEVALKAILRNGHCYGGMDVLTNILHNSLAFLNCGSSGNEGDADESEQVFADLRQLEEYSLAGMVCLLQQIKPHLSKGDAMWCLLMNDLHVGRASVMEIPIASNANGDGYSNSESSGPVVNNVEKVNNDSVGVTPALCRFHGGWGFGNGGTSDFPVNRFLSYAASEMSLQREIECPKRFNLTPSMKMLLKRNVAMFAAGYRATAKDLQVQSRVGSSTLSIGHPSNAVEASCEVPPPPEKTEEKQSEKNQEVVNMMLNKFRDMNLEGDMEYVPEDQKDEMILSLMHQIRDLERQVKERKEWAHQKAMQAARKLSHDLTELKMLRMEREETQRLKQGKPTAEDPTMKRLSEMESALRKASGQVDRANAAVRRLETENAEIRAEMEASKLSASESVNTCLEVARREKKYLKRLLAWEKQRAKLQDDIAAEKRRIIELQEEMLQVEAAKKAAETKWRQEQKAKEHALAQVEEERRLKEASESNNKRKHEALRSKIELDFQRHKDDLQRLEQELSRLKLSTNFDQNSTNPSAAEIPNGSHPQGPTIAKLLHELDDLDEKEAGIDRECIICLKDEVSVVFLPCAHQVLCASCNDEYGTKGKATCLICRVPIEQRIRVFGASS